LYWSIVHNFNIAANSIIIFLKLTKASCPKYFLQSTQGGVENKKEEFKKYLEKTGAVDQLTKILVELY
jgi:hypothetical protein